ncbi:molecular chaperone DnaK [Vulgatibacter incomptus]|uniref:Chaperone protein DnaK n=1 Tax=Vulgatibacter incomptus TaxID=1391653 RepID=A0A0K1P8P6_9BACT|nr:molecular chaperone DnaK [Vulgatibacter incomptus]AKU89781.1 Chaperone protein DnaK [Vulgatibacter incomptus]
MALALSIMNAETTTIGIDLGTTNSVVATVHHGVPTIIPSRTGARLTPSVVAVAANGKKLVGSIARRQGIINPEQTIYSAKRLIGRRFSSKEVTEASRHLPYRVECGLHDDVRLRLGGSSVAVPEISAMILQELRLDAEAWLGRPVERAVITVPAYFNDAQRQATKDAGVIAGLEVMRIINEPTAAALAFGHGRAHSGKIAVFDLGGGTFDISVLQLKRGVYEVLATSGDTFLGGEDFDNRLIEWLLQGFEADYGADLRKEKMAMQRLRDGAEKAKHELSSAREARIELPFLYTLPTGGAALHLQRTLTRETFRELTQDLVERTIRTTAAVLAEAKISPKEIGEVVLVGGQTRSPSVQEAVKRFFGREPSKAVHLDEVVALGAAIQADALASNKADTLLLDVTAQSLGIKVAGGFSNVIIPRNTTIPTSASHRFTTVRDNQPGARILVLQGDEKEASKNELLGDFQLMGLRRAPRGEVEIEVRFDISADGIVWVSAQDVETGQEQSIQVEPSGGMTREELEVVSAQHRDDLRPVDPAAAEQRARLPKLLEEAERLLPALRPTLLETTFGADALAKAERAIAHGREAARAADQVATTSSIHELERTLELFKVVQQRAAGTWRAG